MTNRIANDSKLESKKSIKKGNFTPLQPVTLKIRELRGRPSSKPLIDTGELLNSVRSEKNAMSFKGYGKLQHEGFTVKNNPVIEGELFKFKGKKVPPREWVKFDATKDSLKKFYSGVHKALRK